VWSPERDTNSQPHRNWPVSVRRGGWPLCLSCDLPITHFRFGHFATKHWVNMMAETCRVEISDGKDNWIVVETCREVVEVHWVLLHLLVDGVSHM
jgi:hypothetical protein